MGSPAWSHASIPIQSFPTPSTMSENEGAEMSRRRRSSPAALTSLPDDDDLLREILLRLPPQPSFLPRASAVCRRWRCLTTDPKFIARFRAHHRKPPLLGVLQHRDQDIVFTPILDPPDRIPPGRFDMRIRQGPIYVRSYLGAQLLGCRHGRVLVVDQVRAEVIVFDPITAEQRRFPVPSGFKAQYLNGAVVCAARDQGHADSNCHLSHFKVVVVSMGNDEGRSVACVYSSESGTWGELITSEVLSPTCCGGSASTLIGNVLYWPFKLGMDNILEFDLDRQRLDVIKGPPGMDDTQRHQIVRADDGALGIALFTGRTIQMFQRKVNCQGVATWSFWKFVEAYSIPGLPPSLYRKRGWLEKFLGYDEDTNAMFFYAVGSVFMVQLKSLHSKKLYETSYSNAMPCHAFSSFYTPAITGGGTETLHDG